MKRMAQRISIKYRQRNVWMQICNSIYAKNGGGSIINTTSMAAFNGDFMRTTYGSSKAGVVSLTRYVAAQYGKTKYSVVMQLLPV